MCYDKMIGVGAAQKVNEPKNARAKQQALRAWQPILKVGNICATFHVAGVAFIFIGAVPLIHYLVKELIIDLTLSLRKS